VKNQHSGIISTTRKEEDNTEVAAQKDRFYCGKKNARAKERGPIKAIYQVIKRKQPINLN
jgi:hypothetical protein